MATIQSDDVVFATLTQRGSTLASLKLSGITSMTHLLEYVHRYAGTLRGMATLVVRNSSQGWTSKQALYMR
jgi:hypothetical protein